MQLLKIANLLILSLLLTACGSKQTQRTTQAVEAQTAVLESSQDAVQARGANVKGQVDKVYTENVTGISVEWFIIGALVFGMMIPQPRLLRAVF